MVIYSVFLAFICKMKPKSKRKRFPENDGVHDLERLGKRIRELRLKKGFSNYENFAYDHDIPRAQYGRYEKGEDLRFLSLMKVVRALGVTLEEFFGKGY